QGDYENMEKYYLMAIEQNNVSAMYNLSVYYVNQRDDENAKKYCLMTLKHCDFCHLDASINIIQYLDKNDVFIDYFEELISVATDSKYASVILTNNVNTKVNIVNALKFIQYLKHVILIKINVCIKYRHMIYNTVADKWFEKINKKTTPEIITGLIENDL